MGQSIESTQISGLAVVNREKGNTNTSGAWPQLQVSFETAGLFVGLGGSGAACGRGAEMIY